MKREEIKATLEKIQPREELIQETLRKAEAQKNKKTVFSFWKTGAYRYAAAVCTLMLLCSVGLMTGKLSGDKNAVPTPQGTSVARNLHQEDAEESGALVAFYALEEEPVQTQGVLRSYTLCELTGAEKASGIIAHALLTVRPEQGTEISAEMFIYEEAMLQKLENAVSGTFTFLLQKMQEEETVWEVLDFSAPDVK